MSVAPTLLSREEQRTLIEIAKAAVLKRSGAGETLPPRTLTPLQQSARGIFVTLKVNGELRGCIGQVEPQLPLHLAAAELAVAAATRDVRFAPITDEDLAKLSVEISVLTPNVVIRSPDEIEVGVHGIIISRGRRRGLLLPQVAIEHHLDAESFLDATCEKAGLEPDAWQDPMTRIEIFSAQVFTEDAPRIERQNRAT